MKKQIFAFALASALFTAAGYGQNDFTNCAAAFLDNKIVVNEYSPEGKCVLSARASGELTVCTADLSPASSTAVEQLDFRIAIRDRQTGTLISFSDKTYRRIDVREVLEQCRPGDHIVLLTVGRQYALPHNEILVDPETSGVDGGRG
ncbi:MAG: hypothetical protein IPH12_01660 [Saprospirales bacterium]|nr:hypothetical protein [Saprospirales bacterium]